MLQLLVPETVCKPVINSSDVVNIFVSFDWNPTKMLKIDQKFWIHFCLFNLQDLHKLIFTKRCKAEKNKLFLQSESKYFLGKIKNIIISEFGSACNSAELDEILSKRKMKEGESLDDYYLVMKKLRSRSNIEDFALI